MTYRCLLDSAGVRAITINESLGTHVLRISVFVLAVCEKDTGKEMPARARDTTTKACENNEHQHQPLAHWRSKRDARACFVYFIYFNYFLRAGAIQIFQHFNFNHHAIMQPTKGQ